MKEHVLIVGERLREIKSFVVINVRRNFGMTKEMWIKAYDELLDEEGIEQVELLPEEEQEKFFERVEVRVADNLADQIDNTRMVT